MAEDKESVSIPLSQTSGGATIHTPPDPDDVPKSPPSSPTSSTRKVYTLLTRYFGFFFSIWGFRFFNCYGNWCGQLEGVKDRRFWN